MTGSRKRVSYLLPPPSYPVPRLKLPPGRGAADNRLAAVGRVGPLLVADEAHAEDGDGERKSNHPKHRLGVACLALDTSTVLEGRGSPEGILYSGGRDGMVMAWGLGLAMKKRNVQPRCRRASERAGQGHRDHERGRELGLDDDSEEQGRDEEDDDGRGQGETRFIRNRWECITGWADELEFSDDEVDSNGGVASAGPGAITRSGSTSDGDVLGDVSISATVRRRHMLQSLNTIPYERQWELDLAVSNNRLGTMTTNTRFRQCAQTHEDWVNDILLCNYSQTLVSASSDGTVKAWNPHSQPSSKPSVIGLHSDYVRCIAQSREQRWVASGSFDRSIKLWDISYTFSSASPSSSQTKPKHEPLATLTLPDYHYSSSPSTFARHSANSSPKSSIYALATDQFGHIVASGSPERVIRLWDPRTGKRTGKLVGHTDNIRAILVSEDCRYLLTGSADASIKLWSLVSQRCLHTFMHHTDSVWALHSTHPSLEIFYSGDKSGLVCKVDVEGCAAVSEGECVLLCDESSLPVPGSATEGRARGTGGGAGINKIVSMDDTFIWTASGTSSINRWRVPQRRCVRAANYPSLSLSSRHHEDKDTTSIDSSSFAHFPNTSPPSLFQSSHSHGAGGMYEIPHTQTSTRPSTALATSTAVEDTSYSVSVPIPFPVRHSVGFEGGESDHGNDYDQENTLFGIPYESLIRLSSPNDYYATRGGGAGHGSRSGTGGGGVGSGGAGGGRYADADVATLYSAASFLSIPRALTIAGIGPLNRTIFQRSSQQQLLRQPYNYPAQPQQPQYQVGSPGSSPRAPPHLSASPLLPRTRTVSPEPDSRQSHLFTTRSFSSLKPPSAIQHPPLLSNSRSHELHDVHVLASDATPLSQSPDYVIPGDVGLVRALVLNDRIHVLTVDTSGEVVVWDIVRGICVGKFGKEEDDGSVENADRKAGDGNEETRDNGVRGGKSPREVLEAVRERIEGHGVTTKWASVDTKGGVLVIHLNERCFEGEVYADEVGYGQDKGQNDEVKINLGKWVLRNLFIGFIKEEQRIRKEQLAPSSTPSPTEPGFNSFPPRGHRRRTSSSPEVPKRLPRGLPSIPTFSSNVVVSAPSMIPALPPSISPLSDTQPFNSLMTPLIPIQPVPDDVVTPMPDTPNVRSRLRLRTAGSTDSFRNGRPQVNVAVPSRTSTATSLNNTPATPSATEYSHKGADFSALSNVSANANVVPPAPEVKRPITPPAGLIGKLKSLGGKMKKPSEMVSSLTSHTTTTTGSVTSGSVAGAASAPSPPTTSHDNRKSSAETSQKDGDKVAIQHILTSTLTPPTPTEAPIVSFPPNTLIMISEEPSQNVYRGTVGSTHYDVRTLEEVMPPWLMTYLLQNKIASVPQPSKISFVLLPWASKDPEEASLPELLNTTQSKLTASKYLRVRKLVSHVHEKLDKVIHGSRRQSLTPPASPSSSGSDESRKSMTKPRAEDVYEILCSGVLLPSEMTLTAVRQYVWKSSAELTMYYRLKAKT